MKIKINQNGITTEDVVKRMVFLAYNACGGSQGMGILQEMRLGGRNAEEDEVWRCAYNAEDYPGGRGFKGVKENEVYCDYVFGRMMKWGCSWDKDTIKIRDFDFRPDYQGFSLIYPNNFALAEATLSSLQITDYEITEAEAD